MPELKGKSHEYRNPEGSHGAGPSFAHSLKRKINEEAAHVNRVVDISGDVKS